MPSPHSAQATRGPLKPGKSSGSTWTFTNGLSRAKVAVRNSCQFKVFSKSLHGSPYGSSFLRGGPRMRLARLDERQDGHHNGESSERAIADNSHASERFGSRQAAAVDVHVQKVGARNHAEKPEQDQRDQGSRDA